jgi:hypothetical protein
MTVSWVSESVPPMGAIKGEGVTKQLGRPRLDRLTVLVREAAQNSWDAAARSRERPVHFGIDLCDLPTEVASAWRRLIGQGAPAGEHLPLRSTLERPQLAVLFVSDRGTTGLGGPTRANQVVAGAEHDYVSFVLNVGDPRDTEHGGGTYGYGKAVFFRESTASTVVVYTRCTNEDGEDESRLVGCALGPGFDLDGCAYTGRHWLGVPAGGQVVDPALGDDADRIADELGFPAFEKGEHGTTIAVLAPKLDGRGDDNNAMRVVADSILWHLWPKMVARDNDEPPMTFSVGHNGARIGIADPAEHPALTEFVRALEDLDGSGEMITYGAGASPVGKILLRTTFAPRPMIDEVGQAAGLGRGINHCCLMRLPELVVEYRAGPPLPDERIWYAGVFRVLPERDETFASAEPPTHDAWSPDDLDDRDRSIVRTTLRKIDERLKRQASPASGDDGGGSSDGLAAVSRFLGSLLAPAAGQAAGGGNRQGTASRTRSSVRMVGAPRWDKHDGQDVLIQEFEVDTGSSITVEAETSVRVWGGGGKETAPPPGAGEPTLLVWCAPDGSVHPPGRLAITHGEQGRWQAVVLTPRDTAARIRVREAKTNVGNG